MKEDNFDLRLKKLIQDEIEAIEVDNEAKDRIKARLGLHQMPRRKKRFKLPLVAGILLVLGVVSLFLVPQSVTAINLKLLKTLEYFVKEKTNNISQTFGEQNQIGETPPPNVSNDNITLKDAMQKLPFLLEMPTELPTQYVLENVSVAGEDNYMRISLQYSGPDGGLIIKARGIVEDGSLGSIYDVDDTEAKTIIINGKEGKIFKNKSGRTLIQWYMQGVIYNIEGKLLPEKMVEIAKSFKYREPK